MKNSMEVLAHLFSSPCFEKLHTHIAIQCFIQMLPFSIKRGIAFGYVREKTLFLAFSHPAFMQEFYHKKPLIENLLKEYQNKKQDLLGVQGIKTFLKNTPYQKEVKSLQEKEMPLCYGELSKGEFINHATTQEIQGLFEEIREIILKQQ